MNENNSALVIGTSHSWAEALAAKLPGSHVVCAFNTLPSEVLFAVYEARHTAQRPSLVYCGDDLRSTQEVAGLIRDVGFEPVDALPLRIARHTEPFALLMGPLAYDGPDGPELAYRIDRFKE